MNPEELLALLRHIAQLAAALSQQERTIAELRRDLQKAQARVKQLETPEEEATDGNTEESTSSEGH